MNLKELVFKTLNCNFEVAVILNESSVKLCLIVHLQLVAA